MIRPLEKEDRAAVLDLLRATNNFNPAELAIAAELIDIVLEQPRQRDYYAFVAKTPIAGFLLLGPVPATAGAWHLYWIAVHPSAQGSGVAHVLQLSAESFVRDRGGYWLLAETSSQPGYQRVRAFYCKEGYVELVRIPDYYKPADDLILYGKRFPAPAALP